MRKGFKYFGLWALALMFLSSCNRGVGCPSDFSLDVPVAKIINMVLEIVNF